MALPANECEKRGLQRLIVDQSARRECERADDQDNERHRGEQPAMLRPDRFGVRVLEGVDEDTDEVEEAGFNQADDAAE